MPPANLPESRFATRAGAAALAFLLAVAWHNSFSVPFLFDDEKAIVANPTLDSLGSALFPPTDSGTTVSGRPLLNLSFALNRMIHGLALPGYHLGNLLIHLGAALCLFGLVRRTLALRRAPSGHVSTALNPTALAWFAAALWAVHPLQTESVTYIVQRAEALVGFCLLFTLYAFARGVAANSHGWLRAAVAGCWIGMTAKEVMAAAPLLLFLYDRTFLAGTFREAWQQRRGLHLACMASWLLLAGLVLSSGGRGSTVGYDVINWPDYAATQGAGIVGYLRKAIVPVGLVFDHGIMVENRPAVVVAGLALVATLLGITLWLLRRRPAAGFLGAWFFLILAPSSSVIPVASQTLAEHRMYLPLAAVVVAVGLTLSRLPRNAAVALLSVLVVAAVSGTIVRNRDYATALTLWQDTVDKAPRNARALNNLGLELWRAGQLDAARAHLARAVELAPDHPDACSNLGAVMIEQLAAHPPTSRDPGQIEAGLRLLRHAVELDPARAVFHAEEGAALFSLTRYDEAAAAFARARQLEPRQRVHLLNLANSLARSSRPADAAPLYREYLDESPADANVRRDYGILLRRLGAGPDSLRELAIVARSDDSALTRTQLGISLYASGRREEALREFEVALQREPDFPLALKEKGYALAEGGRPAEAIAVLERLVSVTPPTAEILSNLSVLYSRAGRREDALAALRRAVQLDPANSAARRNLDRLEGR